MASFFTSPQILKTRLHHIKYLLPLSERIKFNHCLNMTTKPPNILIYCQNKNESEKVTNLVQSAVTSDRFVIYTINKESLVKDPWMDSTKLLLLGQNESGNNQETTTRVLNFVENGGKVIDFSDKLLSQFGIKLFNESLQHSNTSCKQYKIIEEKELIIYEELYFGYQNVLALSCQHSTSYGKIIFTDLTSAEENMQSMLMKLGFVDEELSTNTNDHQMLPPTTPYFIFTITQDQGRQFVETLKAAKPSNISLMSLEDTSCTNFKASSANDGKYTLVYNTSTSPSIGHSPSTFQHFNWDVYKKHLSSKTFGQIVLYSEVTSTTMDVLNRMITSDPGPVAIIARQQTGGLGRGGNKWLSPIGCAMFTMCFSIPLRSTIGQNISITQHMMALALVQAVRSKKGLQDLDLQIKWPNDIYAGRKVKIGGVLTKSSIFRDKLFIYIGLGVNLDNEQPTVCINQLIREQQGTELLSEELIARTISCLERIINNYQIHGPKEFLKLYHQHWMHDGQEVTIDVPDIGNASGTITSIDEAGFLKVCLKSSPQDVTVQPDGNSFDITKNLIYMK